MDALTMEMKIGEFVVDYMKDNVDIQELIKKTLKDTIADKFENIKDTMLKSLVELMEQEYREVASYCANKELKEAVQGQGVKLEGNNEDCQRGLDKGETKLPSAKEQLLNEIIN